MIEAGQQGLLLLILARATTLGKEAFNELSKIFKISPRIIPYIQAHFHYRLYKRCILFQDERAIAIASRRLDRFYGKRQRLAIVSGNRSLSNFGSLGPSATVSADVAALRIDGETRRRHQQSKDHSLSSFTRKWKLQSRHTAQLRF